MIYYIACNLTNNNNIQNQCKYGIIDRFIRTITFK